MTPRTAAALIAALACAGCTALDPFPTFPAAAERGPPDAGPRVAVCADPLVSSRAEVLHAAQQQCPPHSSARLVATDWLLDYCPMLLPKHATFVCTPAK